LGFKGQYHPNQRGFDEFYGLLGGSRSYFPSPSPEKDVKHYKNIEKNGEHVKEDSVTYITDDFTNAALAFIERRKNDPFFMYLSYTAAHSPFEAKEEDLKEVSHIKDEKHRIIAAMVQSMDKNVGRVVALMKSLGLHENTMYVYLNDNGGIKESDNGKLKSNKGKLYEGGIKVPMFISYRPKIEPGQRYPHMVSALDLLPTSLAVAGQDSIEDERVVGKNLLHYLGTEEKPHERLLFKFWSQKAIRKGDYKLYLNGKTKTHELYNIQKDPYEKSDLLKSHPELAKALQQELDDWVGQLPEQMW
jgi:arylsulfatase A-like enzyme